MPRSLLVAAALACLLHGSVQADYALPEVTARHLLLLDDGRVATVQGRECIQEGDQRVMVAATFYRIEARHRDQAFTWSIDLFWLADRIDSNSICTGDHRRAMEDYLVPFCAEPRPAGKLVVELVKTEGRAEFFVAGLWTLAQVGDWTRACEQGSAPLGMTPEQVRSLGSAEALQRQFEDRSQASWAALVRPAAEGGDAKWIVEGHCDIPGQVKAHGTMNCIVTKWTCPRCEREVESLVWKVCEGCCKELGICIVCNKRT